MFKVKHVVTTPTANLRCFAYLHARFLVELIFNDKSRKLTTIKVF